jgi:hypothetical protein
MGSSDAGAADREAHFNGPAFSASYSDEKWKAPGKAGAIHSVKSGLR